MVGGGECTVFIQQFGQYEQSIFGGSIKIFFTTYTTMNKTLRGARVYMDVNIPELAIPLAAGQRHGLLAA